MVSEIDDGLDLALAEPDHAFEPGVDVPWCQKAIGHRLVRTAERPAGATYKRVPITCNRDREDHPR